MQHYLDKEPVNVPTLVASLIVRVVLVTVGLLLVSAALPGVSATQAFLIGAGVLFIFASRTAKIAFSD